MLSWISADGIPHTSGRAFGLVPGLNVVCGPVGSGKSMLFRDCLFLLLAGKVPGARTLAALGDKCRLTASVCAGGKSVTVTRNGAKVAVLEDQDAKTAAAVCERVASFTGIPSSRLFELCYVSGLTLPSTVLTPGNLLNLVRAAAGIGGLQAFGQQVNSALSDAEIELRTLAEHAAVPAADAEPASSALARAETRMAEIRAWLEGNAAAERLSRDVMAASLSAEVRTRLGALEAELGPLASAADAAAVVDSMMNYRFLRDLLAPDIPLAMKPGTKDWGMMKEALPRMTEVYERILAMGPALDADPNRLRGLLSERDRLKSVPVTSEQNREKASRFIAYADRLRAELAELEGQARVCRARMADEARLASMCGRMAGRRAELERAVPRYRQALELLQPGSKLSVERDVVGDLLHGVLGDATAMLNGSGVPGELVYDAASGLRLSRGGAECPAAQLSGGEVSLAALTMRLATDRAFGSSPFLVVDDVTGPLGRLVPAMCDTLAGYAAETGKTIVLITHDPAARGDNILQF